MAGSPINSGLRAVSRSWRGNLLAVPMSANGIDPHEKAHCGGLHFERGQKRPAYRLACEAGETPDLGGAADYGVNDGVVVCCAIPL